MLGENRGCCDGQPLDKNKSPPLPKYPLLGSSFHAAFHTAGPDDFATVTFQG